MSSQISLCPHRLNRDDTFRFYYIFCLKKETFLAKIQLRRNVSSLISLCRLYMLIWDDTLCTCIKPPFHIARLISCLHFMLEYTGESCESLLWYCRTPHARMGDSALSSMVMESSAPAKMVSMFCLPEHTVLKVMYWNYRDVFLSSLGVCKHDMCQCTAWQKRNFTGFSLDGPLDLQPLIIGQRHR